MLQEFEAEERSGSPYRSKRLSEDGRTAFPRAMRNAIKAGNEESLEDELLEPDFWEDWETYERSGVLSERRINFGAAARSLAISEFNTCYVRGLARRLLDQGHETCQIYRAEDAFKPRWECLAHDGQISNVQEIYDGHRARYWPEPGNRDVLSIPSGTNCHHTIRRP